MVSKSVFFLSFLLFYFNTSGQTYFTAGGLRLGNDYGLTMKQRLFKKTTIEAILYTKDNGKSNLGFTLLADKHRSLITRNFNLFYGAGMSWKWEYINQESLEKRTSFGIPLQAGIEFTIGRINLSWDYTPILYISSNSNAFNSLKGLSVRYVFINKKEGKKLAKKIQLPFFKHKK